MNLVLHLWSNCGIKGSMFTKVLSGMYISPVNEHIYAWTNDQNASLNVGVWDAAQPEPEWHLYYVQLVISLEERLAHRT